MPKRLTRREFLKYSGQAIALSGAACAAAGLGSPRRAEAATEIQLDGRELVGRVGDTFATIQLVPEFTKTRRPLTIVGKVQYSTDPGFSTYAESGQTYAESFRRGEKGHHVGPDGSDTLVASQKYHFLSWNWQILPGDLIHNKTDGSVMIVSQVLDDQTIEGSLSGGIRNCWNTGDKWKIHRTYYCLEIKLTGLLPSTKYYYRVLLKREGDGWPAPRAAHSFQTRRTAGESFRFGIWADSHRSLRVTKTDRKYWPQWDALVAALASENVDFLIDLGDSWPVTKGTGKPLVKRFPELYSTVMKPARNGKPGYRGYSDLCSDCGYYLVRGNHDGLSDFDRPRAGKMIRSLLKLFVPNPNGTTYPQGGSMDADYDQGYFAFEWGDALFVAMDAVKYKETKKANDSPARFHIGEAQLAWLSSVLQNSTRRWKLIFMHHLFGGGNNYARGGAAFAFDYEQAQIQALAEQYGAHIFYGHDHLLAAEMANGVNYYCCGLAWGGQSDYIGRKTGEVFDILYPNGFTSTSCKSEPPACENNGYAVVEVTPSQVTIQYKSYLGYVVDELVLT